MPSKQTINAAQTKETLEQGVKYIKVHNKEWLQLKLTPSAFNKGVFLFRFDIA